MLWYSLSTVPYMVLLVKQCTYIVILHAFLCSLSLTCAVTVVHTVRSFCCSMYIHSMNSSIANWRWKSRFNIRHPSSITASVLHNNLHYACMYVQNWVSLYICIGRVYLSMIVLVCS